MDLPVLEYHFVVRLGVAFVLGEVSHDEVKRLSDSC
jgi:hypothetical protein